jgi:hypothetical protein
MKVDRVDLIELIFFFFFHLSFVSVSSHVISNSTQVEVPKNRAFPVMGHATCPDCFDLGPHTKTYIKLKSGLFSHKKVCMNDTLITD